MQLNRACIQRLVPHTDAMCLLDAVTDWQAQSINCLAAAPGVTHPLSRDGKVPAIIAVEYAAQAAAVHGALLDQAGGAKMGVIAKLSSIEIPSEWFPCAVTSIAVYAQLLSRTTQACLYEFRVMGGGCAIAQGRLLIAFES